MNPQNLIFKEAGDGRPALRNRWLIPATVTWGRRFIIGGTSSVTINLKR